MDLCANIKFNNSLEKKLYLDLLKKVKFSHLKVDDYSTSIHAHNKSFCYNIYDKNAQCKYKMKDTLRIENQFKNSCLYRLVRSNDLDGKTFSAIMSNPEKLNSIYKERLKRIGLDKKFLTKNKMAKFLEKLYNENKLGKVKYTNMYNYFINNSISISNNTLNNYKSILAKYDYSHILINSKNSKKINFMNLQLFTQRKYYILTMTNLISNIIKFLQIPLIKIDSNTTNLFGPILNFYTIPFIDDS